MSKLDSRVVKHVLNVELNYHRHYGRTVADNNGLSKDFQRGFKAGVMQAIRLVREMEKRLAP